jgi:hypothetical protein
MLVQQTHKLTFNYDVETKIIHNAALRCEQRYHLTKTIAP